MSQHRKFDESSTSDNLLLVKVEDLISLAFGPSDGCVISFKMVQTILHILARHMRLLEQDIELRFADEEVMVDKLKQGGYLVSADDSDATTDDTSKGRKKKLKPEGQTPGGQAPGGQMIPGGQVPGRQMMPGGQVPGGQVPGGQTMPGGQVPGGQVPGGQMMPGEQVPGGQMMPGGQVPGGQVMPGGQVPGGQMSGGQMPDGQQGPGGQMPGGQGPGGQMMPGGQGPGGQMTPGGQIPGGQGPGGQMTTGGQTPGGQGPGGQMTPGGQGPGGQMTPGGQMPGGQEPGGQMTPGGQGPGGQMTPGGQMPGGQGPGGQMTTGVQGPGGQMTPGGQGPEGQGPEGQMTPGGQMPGGLGPGVQMTPGGQGPGGQMTPGGQMPGGQGPGGQMTPGGQVSGDQTKGGKQKSYGGIAVKEERRGKGKDDKVLIVEKGPAARFSRTRIGSIEVVTQSEFEILEAAVQRLIEKTGEVPKPTMPTNEKLLTDLARGTASLPDAMEAMQLNARVQAAEEALTRMAGLLTQLTGAGAVPPELTKTVYDLEENMQQLGFKTRGPQGTAVDQSVRPVDQFSRPINQPSRPLAQFGQREDQPTQAKDSKYPVDPFGRPGDQSGRPVDHSGRPVDQSGRPVDQSGRSLDQSGRFVDRYAQNDKTLQFGPFTAPAAVVEQPTQHYVKFPDMNEALNNLKKYLLDNMSYVTNKSAATVEYSSFIIKNVAEKMNQAMSLDQRVRDCQSLMAAYVEELNGFDAGINTQLQSFREQMAQLQTDLNDGLLLLKSPGSNPESAALSELKSNYATLLVQMDQTVNRHNLLVNMHSNVTKELKTLLECLEILREQKSDRDEILDGLRDKASISRLHGLLTEEDFDIACKELNDQINASHDKFKRQEEVWLMALKDLSDKANVKASVGQLLSLRDYATETLNEHRILLKRLEMLLGEPKAAALVRKLARDAFCAACAVPALMDATDASRPLVLPPLLKRGERAEPCVTPRRPMPPDLRDHVCKRWVGGSHTLLNERVTRVRPLAPIVVPTRHYDGDGIDGHVYKMEEDLLPCIECNTMSLPPAVSADGDNAKVYRKDIILEKIRPASN